MTEDEARYEQWMDDLYEEHRERAIEEFTTDRLKSYYLGNPWVLRPPVEALTEAQKLAKEHTTAAHVLATIAVEVGLKVALLKHVVYGLVHSEATAEIIADLTLRHTRFDFFDSLLLRILGEHGGVDLERYTRTRSIDSSQRVASRRRRVGSTCFFGWTISNPSVCCSRRRTPRFTITSALG